MKTRILTLALIALVPFTAKADCVSTLIGSGINPLAATNICTIQGDLVASGTVSGSRFIAGDGNQSGPAFRFNDDPDTGIFRDNSNTISFATGANKRMQVSSTGVLLSSGGYFATSSADLVSAGTTQGDAADIITGKVTVSGATGTQGAKLPLIATATIGSIIHGVNTGGGILKLYPNTGNSINAGALNGSVDIAAGAFFTCWARASTNWRCTETPAA